MLAFLPHTSEVALTMCEYMCERVQVALTTVRQVFDPIMH
jgi:hypothetical protein